MKWISFLMHCCALLVSALPATAAYHCSPMTLRELPVMTDKPYTEVRRNLIALGWQPIPHGMSKFPETRSCSTQAFVRCDFILSVFKQTASKFHRILSKMMIYKEYKPFKISHL